MKIKILTDSAADCTPEEIEENSFIIAQMPVNFDGVECEDISIEDFWQKLLSGGVARTSQPSREFFLEEFTKVKENGEGLICVLISSALSGTFQTAEQVKSEVGYENIAIIDSGRASAAEKYVALEAKKLVDKGLEFDEIVEKLNSFKKRVRLYACLDTLKYLSRGGRLPTTVAAIGNLLHLKPIITFTEFGEITVPDKKMGTRKAMDSVCEFVTKANVDEKYSLCPLFANTVENVQMFLKKLSAVFSAQVGKLTQIGATIGTYIGPDAFGIVFVERE